MDRFGELLLAWEEGRDRGESVTPDVLCPDDPALRQALAEQIGLIQACDRLLDLGSDTAGCLPVSPPVPERVGKYQVKEVLGRGGMGVVYRGWDAALRRPVALKLIRSPFSPAGSRLAARFEREGHALAQLKHPNIVGVYEAGVHDGRPYLVMEFVPGGSLADHRQRLTAAGSAAVLALLGKVCRAVQFAHDRGVLHRDLKPANILLGPGDEPLVADFGLARLRDPDLPDAPAVPADAETLPDTTVALTDTAQPGTPAYMAPEQHDPRAGPVGPWTDVWALGVVLHELLTGRRPGPAGGRSDGPASPAVPGRLARVVARCLEVDPGRRYQTAGELADELGRLRRPTRRTALVAGVAATLAAGLGIYAARLAARDATGVDSPPVDLELEGYTDPAAVRQALERLSAGEAVTLIDRGEPAAYRLNLGASSGRALRTEGGWRIQGGGDYCLVELLPRLPPGAWVIEAVLRHELPQRNGMVGVFTACTRARGAEGWENLLFALTFTGTPPPVPPESPSDQAATRLVIVRESTTVLFPVREQLIRFWKLGSVLTNTGHPPQIPLTASVTVGPEGLTAALGGRAFPTCSAEKLEEARGQAARLPPAWALPAGLIADPHGGVGIYARFAIAFVERFVVRPL